MKITPLETMRKEDAERVARAYKTLAAIGNTGGHAMHRYPPHITDAIEKALDALQSLQNK